MVSTKVSIGFPINLRMPSEHCCQEILQSVQTFSLSFLFNLSLFFVFFFVLQIYSNNIYQSHPHGTKQWKWFDFLLFIYSMRLSFILRCSSIHKHFKKISRNFLIYLMITTSVRCLFVCLFLFILCPLLLFSFSARLFVVI